MADSTDIINENGRLQVQNRELAELVRLRDIEIVQLKEEQTQLKKRNRELESQRRLEPRVRELERLVGMS